MNELRPIKSKEQYQLYIAELDRIFDKESTPELFEYKRHLSILIADYESKNFDVGFKIEPRIMLFASYMQDRLNEFSSKGDWMSVDRKLAMDKLKWNIGHFDQPDFIDRNSELDTCADIANYALMLAIQTKRMKEDMQ